MQIWTTLAVPSGVQQNLHTFNNFVSDTVVQSVAALDCWLLFETPLVFQFWVLHSNGPFMYFAGRSKLDRCNWKGKRNSIISSETRCLDSIFVQKTLQKRSTRGGEMFLVCLWLWPGAFNMSLFPKYHFKSILWRSHTWDRSGTYFCVDKSVTATVVQGLAAHKDELGAPLCPCRHYDDKQAEADAGFWNCPCVPMRERKVRPPWVNSHTNYNDLMQSYLGNWELCAVSVLVVPCHCNPKNGASGASVNYLSLLLFGSCSLGCEGMTFLESDHFPNECRF